MRCKENKNLDQDLRSIIEEEHLAKRNTRENKKDKMKYDIKKENCDFSKQPNLTNFIEENRELGRKDNPITLENKAQDILRQTTLSHAFKKSAKDEEYQITTQNPPEYLV